jgi:hypothetical protein
MDNVTAAHGEELPHHLLEAIHKLLHAGASREAISMTLGLKLEVVQLVLAKDSSQIAHDASYYKRSRIESDSPKSSALVLISPKKKAKISEICKESRNDYTQDLQTPHEDTRPPSFTATCTTLTSCTGLV